MRCPRCDMELAPGNVFCPVCGQEVQIAPDYDPLDEMLWDGTEPVKKQNREEAVQQNHGTKRKHKASVKSCLSAIWKDPLSRKICLTTVVLLICAGTAGLSYYLVSRQNQYSYQLRKGIDCYENGQLEEAISFLKRARELQTDEEAEDERSLLYLARTYGELGETDMAADVFEEVLRFPLEEKEKLILYEELFQMLSQGDRAEKINGLIDACEDEALQRRLLPYRIEKPQVDMVGGVYHYYVYPRLEAEYGTIFYTLDGSTPTSESTPYTEKIALQEGENMLTAVAINEKGIVSEQLFVVYTLDFDVPVDTSNKNDTIDYGKMTPPQEESAPEGAGESTPEEPADSGEE